MATTSKTMLLGQGSIYVEGDYVEIEANSFVNNTAGPSAWWPGIVQVESTNSATIHCNLFFDNAATGTDPTQPGGVMTIRGLPSHTWIDSNNIYPGTADYDLVVGFESSGNLNATNNYWGTTDESAMSDRIYDFYDDFYLPEVIYHPYELSVVPCALLVPPTVSFATSSPDWQGQHTSFTNTTTLIPPDDLSVAYLWSFGDGATSTNPTHTYSAPGTYTAVLTVTNSVGTDVISGIVALYGPPTADFTADPTHGVRPLSVMFTDCTTTTPPDDASLLYSWDFGDGQFGNASSPVHVYEAAGAYTVTMSASNPAGTDMETKVAHVTVEEGYKLYLSMIMRTY